MMGYLTHGAKACGKTYDLLPCPHCGGEAEFRDGSSTKPYIRCKGCGCRTGSSFDYGKLASSWNRRAERTCRVESSHEDLDGNYEHELSCGHSVTWPWPWLPGYCPDCGARVEVDDD